MGPLKHTLPSHSRIFYNNIEPDARSECHTSKNFALKWFHDLENVSKNSSGKNICTGTFVG